jgi:hypothetical protein
LPRRLIVKPILLQSKGSCLTFAAFFVVVGAFVGKVIKFPPKSREEAAWFSPKLAMFWNVIRELRDSSEFFPKKKRHPEEGVSLEKWPKLDYREEERRRSATTPRASKPAKRAYVEGSGTTTQSPGASKLLGNDAIVWLSVSKLAPGVFTGCSIMIVSNEIGEMK